MWIDSGIGAGNDVLAGIQDQYFCEKKHVFIAELSQNIQDSTMSFDSTETSDFVIHHLCLALQKLTGIPA